LQNIEKEMSLSSQTYLQIQIWIVSESGFIGLSVIMPAINMIEPKLQGTQEFSLASTKTKK
jgi:hypothetical protein